MKTKVDLEKVKAKLGLSFEAGSRRRQKKILDRMISKGQMTIEVAKRIMRNEMSPIPGLEPNCIFFYKKKYYLTDGKKLTKPSETEVETAIAGETKTNLFLLYSERVCPMPEPFHLESVETHTVKDDNEAVKFMSERSGLPLSIKDL